jgi:hypothetical protein
MDTTTYYAIAIISKQPAMLRFAAAIDFARMRMGEPLPDRVHVHPLTAAELGNGTVLRLIPDHRVGRNEYRFPRAAQKESRFEPDDARADTRPANGGVDPYAVRCETLPALWPAVLPAQTRAGGVVGADRDVQRGSAVPALLECERGESAPGAVAGGGERG